MSTLGTSVPVEKVLDAALEHAAGLPEGPISPFDFACASYLYEAMTNYSRSLQGLREDVGLDNVLDLADEDHRLRLLKFLNEWVCRNLAKDCHGLASTRLERWCGRARDRLDVLVDPPWPPGAQSRRDVADVFTELSTSIASRRTQNGRKVAVSFGPTATAKTLFILRPSLFPAWDRPMRDTFGYGDDGASYAQFTADVHAKIAESAEHCRQSGLCLESLPEVLGRPVYTTLPQLVID